MDCMLVTLKKMLKCYLLLGYGGFMYCSIVTSLQNAEPGQESEAWRSGRVADSCGVSVCPCPLEELGK